MNRHLIFTAVSCALCAPLALAADKTKDKAAAVSLRRSGAPKGKNGKNDAVFNNLHQSFVKIAKANEAQVVFLGDSITRGWSGQKELFDKRYGAYKAANFGIGGDRTEHVLWRVENGEFDGFKPKAVVLMIGTNNSVVADHSPESIASGIDKIIRAIHQRSPETKTLLLAIFPRGAGADKNPTRDKNQKVNALIAKLHDGKKIHFLDIGKNFLAANGELNKEIMPDLLHLSDKGYQIWADSIRDKLAELAKAP